MSVNILALIGKVTTVALKLPRSVWIPPPEVEPTVGATEGFGATDGFGVTEGLGVTDGLGVGVGVGDGEGLGDGDGEGEGLGSGVEISEGEGEGVSLSGDIYAREAAYTVSPNNKAKTRTKGIEIIPKLFLKLGIDIYRIRVQPLLRVTYLYHLEYLYQRNR